MGISPTQLLIILVIVALIFGTKKLRNIGGDLGGAVKGFKKAVKDEEDKKSIEQSGGETIDITAEKVSTDTEKKDQNV